MLVALDGPAGAGKSTVARAVADALGFTYLDTGAMYRCVGLRATAAPDAVLNAAALDIAFEGDRVLLDGEDVTSAIRTPEAGLAASRVATDPAIRTTLVALQQKTMAAGDWVAEGRDIGTVVAPEAEVKVWLTADPEERARRRQIPVAELMERDERDAARETSPMKPAAGAIVVDTTGLTLEAVIARITALVRDADPAG